MWSDNERMLGTTRQHHYRVKHNRADDSYSVILYSTEMARFYKPEDDGTIAMDLTWDTRTTSTSFMHHCVWQGNVEQADTSCGRKVYRVIRAGATNHYVYDSNGKLILERSKQEIVKRIVSNPALSAWKAQAKERLSPLTNLLELRVEQEIAVAESATRGWKEGKAFATNDAAERIRYKLREYNPALDPWEDHVDALKDLYAAAVCGVVAVRQYKDRAATPWKKAGPPYTPPSPKTCTTAFYGYIAKLSGVGEKTTVHTNMWPDVTDFAQTAISPF
jgi:hypothetical protein